MNKLLMITFALSFVSCAVSKTKLSDEAKEIKVLAQKQTEGCHVIDKVIGMNEKGSDELARNHAKNLAADLDGNALYIDDVVANANDVKVYATVYQCEK